MIISIPDVWNAAVVKHNNYVVNELKEALTELSTSAPDFFAPVQLFIQTRLNEIISWATDDFSASIEDYDSTFPKGTAQREAVNTIMKKVFDYDKFRDARSGWSAYSLCELSSYRVCPYCHIASIAVTQRTETTKGMRPQLDHFIARSEYPFLALSLRNLVPCCADCNGPSCKHKTNVLTTPLLNPLKDSEVLSFKVVPKRELRDSPIALAMRAPRDSYEIEIEGTKGNAASKNSVKTFQLTSRYQACLPDAYRIARMDRNPAWIRTIAEKIGLILPAEVQLGFSPKPGSSEFRNAPQGKMRLDIYRMNRMPQPPRLASTRGSA
jgi:hypothetical protein